MCVWGRMVRTVAETLIVGKMEGRRLMLKNIFWYIHFILFTEEQ